MQLNILYIVVGILVIAGIGFIILGGESDSVAEVDDTRIVALEPIETDGVDAPGDDVAQQGPNDTPGTVSGASHGVLDTFSEEKLALAEDGDVVLFFKASWCPTCRALEDDIKANIEDLPVDVAILTVDYDTATALKQRYGVTIQHTLVQVDADGALIQKWSGGTRLSDVLARL